MSYIRAAHITNEVLSAILAFLVTSLSENSPVLFTIVFVAPSLSILPSPLASSLESPLSSLALAHLCYSHHVCSLGLGNPGLSLLGTLGKPGWPTCMTLWNEWCIHLTVVRNLAQDGFLALYVLFIVLNIGPLVAQKWWSCPHTIHNVDTWCV